MYKRSIILPQTNLRDVTMEGKVRGWAAEQDDDELAKEKEEVGDAVEDDHPQQVPHHQLEGRAGGGAEAEALRESFQIVLKPNQTNMYHFWQKILKGLVEKQHLDCK